MGFLNLFTKSEKPKLAPLLAGSFTLDREGRLMTSTLPRSYPEANLVEVGQRLVGVFRSAKEAQIPLTEILVHYNALKLLARELRGGAMIFLMPQSLSQTANQNP
jgi:hypothetical protein